MLRAFALWLTVATGFAGLVYEVAWQRYLATLLGSQAEATAAILGLFLGGLAAGYAGFGALTRRLVARSAQRGRAPRLLLLYGGVEAALGLFGLAFPVLFEAVRGLSQLGPHGSGAAAFAFDASLAALLVVPPTLLMGGTLPVLTQALSRDLRDATHLHARLYAANTAGAFAGALAAGFALVPFLGLAGTVRAAGALDLAAGLAFAALGRGLAAAPARAPERQTRRVRGVGAACAVAALVGFAMMTLQTATLRVAGIAMGASPSTFSLVVAVFVACIAIGSFAVSLRTPPPPAALPLAGLLLLALGTGLYGALGQAPEWAQALRAHFGSGEGDFAAWVLASLGALFAVVGPAVIVSGAILPLLFHHLRRDAAELGAVVGSLYAWNTVGSLAGAWLGGDLLLRAVDLHAVVRVALGALAAAAVLLWVRPLGVFRVASGAVAGVLALAVLAGLPRWDPRPFASELVRQRGPLPPGELERSWRSRRIRSYADGPVSTVAVVERPLPGDRFSRALVTDGTSDGNTDGDVPTAALAAALPALLAERSTSAFVVGYGTGITAGALASLEGMDEVVVAEISPEVIRAAPWFDFASRDASHDPRVRIVRGDAFRTLLRSPGRFDLIVSEPSHPRTAGIERLYSREFLEAARAHLAPGGVHLQWLHQYESDPQTVALVLRTTASVFDTVTVWYGLGLDLLVVGVPAGERAFDLERIAARAERPDLAGVLARAGIRSLPELLAHELVPAGVLAAARLPGPLHTLHRPILADRAARAFFRGGEGTLPFTGSGPAARVGARTSLIRRLAARPDAPPWRADWTRTLCRERPAECVSALAAWQAAEPVAPAREAVMAAIVARAPGRSAAALRETVGEVTRLFGSAPGVAPSLPEVRRLTARFATHYTHGAPFDPEALRALWRAACRREGAACARDFARVVAWLAEGGPAPDLSASEAASGP